MRTKDGFVYLLQRLRSFKPNRNHWTDYPCMEWDRSLTQGGYGQTRSPKGVTVYTHRLAYELVIGPIPVGLEIDHLCRNRKCFCPGHLEPVTRTRNARRIPTNLRGNPLIGELRKMATALMTHCKRGHIYSDENTLTTAKGTRFCRLCRRFRWRMRYKYKSYE